MFPIDSLICIKVDGGCSVSLMVGIFRPIIYRSKNPIRREHECCQVRDRHP